MNWRERIAFLKEALGNKKETGAVTMSSRYVVRDVLKVLPEKFSVVVEYGSGNGVMTKALLGKLSSTGKMLAIESNEAFAVELQQIRDPRLTIAQNLVQNMTDEDMAPYNSADIVISSIPFTFLSGSERNQIISDAYELLAPGGLFIIFNQYSLLMRKPLRDVFGNVSTKFELLNIPPCFIFSARK